MFSKSPTKEEGKAFLLFDGFYAGLLLGLQLGRLSEKSSLEKNNFIIGYPDVYLDSRSYIAGLVVEAELRRLDTVNYSQADYEREIAKLLDPDEPSRLSKENGIEAVNLYAAGGFEYLREKMKPKPTSVQNFLIRYHELWDEEFGDT
ncbi:MAG: hypothetical protein COB36_14230 [Alphaproteobacteria bacterium]|nr:MAG: hypothetical protein COB36_14230 [Alphaproteobacteria bacterium]